jgi:hypothetical protein
MLDRRSPPAAVTRSPAICRRLLGAFVIGVATLFQPKAERAQHWSIPPTFPVQDKGDSVSPGQPRHRAP